MNRRKALLASAALAPLPFLRVFNKDADIERVAKALFVLAHKAAGEVSPGGS